MRAEAATAVLRLDRWLQTMRGPGGYAGPVPHWWESSLVYCGPMADWRYEGVIGGYLVLYQSTGQTRWLDRAKAAAADLIAAQLPSGSYRNSTFQQGPLEGGTPHEAAVDVALLELASVLRHHGDTSWREAYGTASRNIEQYLLGSLWDGVAFVDQPWHPVHVPNKNATSIEALVLFERLSGRDMTQYLDGAARVIMSSRVTVGPRAGATVHLGTGRHRLAIGFYTARSLCGLLSLHERHADDRWLEAVEAGFGFLRGLYAHRGLSFGRYADGRLIADPRMIAAAGDVLRLAQWASRFGIATTRDVGELTSLLVAAQLSSGAIPTAFGFAGKGSRQPSDGRPEFRDVLPAVGWCDKAFRGLAMTVGATILDVPAVETANVSLPCAWKGRRCVFEETGTHMELLLESDSTPLFRWEKGSCYPSVVRL